jgi:hypothetical protein
MNELNIHFWKIIWNYFCSLPGPPPIPLPPLPDSAVESGITVAAKYVALHGASAEQRLIGWSSNLFLVIKNY